MTFEEAIEKLSKKLGENTFCLSREYWLFAKEGNSPKHTEDGYSFYSPSPNACHKRNLSLDDLVAEVLQKFGKYPDGAHCDLVEIPYDQLTKREQVDIENGLT